MQRNDSRRSNDIARTPSRRSVLSLGTAGIVSALGGCSSITGQSTSTPGQSDESVFKGTSIQDESLVVDLREDHDVQRLNLIGPDGRDYASNAVAAGSTRTNLSLLEIAPSDSFHYPIGESNLVAVRSNGNSDKRLKLRPDLEVVGVGQYSGDENRDFGNVEITVRNHGTAPTWIYDIFFPDAPYSEARKEGGGRGSPGLYLKEPSDSQEAVIPPNSERKFVDSNPPFIFDNELDCKDNRIETTVHLKLGFGETISRGLEAEFSGKPVTADAVSFDEMYACKSVEIALNSDMENDE